MLNIEIFFENSTIKRIKKITFEFNSDVISFNCEFIEDESRNSFGVLRAHKALHKNEAGASNIFLKKIGLKNIYRSSANKSMNLKTSDMLALKIERENFSFFVCPSDYPGFLFVSLESTEFSIKFGVPEFDASEYVSWAPLSESAI